MIVFMRSTLVELYNIIIDSSDDVQSNNNSCDLKEAQTYALMVRIPHSNLINDSPTQLEMDTTYN